MYTEVCLQRLTERSVDLPVEVIQEMTKNFEISGAHTMIHQNI